ncbi:MAG: MerR family transcriptional regulator, partial [Pseudomonadota bacterium]
YRPEDIELLREIQRLLYDDGYTIKGVQKLLREGHVKAKAVERAPRPQAVEPSAPQQPSAGEAQVATPASSLPQDVRGQLTDLLQDLKTLRDALRGSD